MRTYPLPHTQPGEARVRDRTLAAPASLSSLLDKRRHHGLTGDRAIARPAPGPVESVMAAFVAFFIANNHAPQVIGVSARPFLLSVYVFTGILLVLGMRQIAGSVRGSWTFAPVALLMPMTTLWSVRPSATLKEGIFLLGITAFAVYLGVRFTYASFVRLLSWLFSATALFSILVEFGRPATDTSGNPVHWSGITGDKNLFGALMAMGVLTWTFRWIAEPSNRRLSGLWVLVMIGLLLLSNSLTSVLLTCVALCPFIPLRLVKRVRGLAGPVIILSGWFGTLIIRSLMDNPERYFGLFGRNSTFSGRNKVWELAWQLIQQKPWLGYGVGSLWGADGALSHDYLMSRVGWVPQHAHNGYLDLLLGAGLLGLLCFALSCLVTLPSVVRLLRSRVPYAPLPAAFVLFFLLYNLLESALIVHSEIFWVVFVSLALHAMRFRASAPSLDLRNGHPELEELAAK